MQSPIALLWEHSFGGSDINRYEDPRTGTPGCRKITHSSLRTVIFSYDNMRGGEIAQWLASLSVKQAVQVHTRHDPPVSESWNSIRCYLLVPTSVDD